ncbi:hypothetical protein MKX08_009052 [Trichoderma sp. CBMAI-0020]|nr:hypothetical protein MKX08_009052 [Trichoderma sp. CBMAI-0020]
MDPDHLDRQMDDLLLTGDSNGTQATAPDFCFDEYEAWLAIIPAVADTTTAANIINEDEEMVDAVLAPCWGPYRGAPDFDSDDDDSVTNEESPISDPFVPSGLWTSGMDEGLASLDLVGSSQVPNAGVEYVTEAIAQYTVTPAKDIIIIDEQQRSQEDVDMVELQRLLFPVIVYNNMTEPEEPTDNATELNRPIPPVLEMTEPEEPLPTVVYATGFEGSISHVVEMAEPEEPISPVDDTVPDAAPNSPDHSVSPPRTPYMGEDDEDWDEQDGSIDLEDMFDFMLERTPPQTPTRARSTSGSAAEFSGEDSPSLELCPASFVRSPGSSLADELEAAMLAATPPRSFSRPPSPDQDVARWAFPSDMVDNSVGAATNLSLNDLFNNRPTIEASNPPTETAADDVSNENPASTDCTTGPDSVTEAQEPASEDHTQAGSSESPDEDTTLASEAVVDEEQQPETEPPTPVTIPTIIVTPEPNRMKEVEVAPIRMGGLLLPGGNLVLPATPAPMTPLPQQVKTPDAEELQRQKDESLARDLRNVMRRRRPASIFHPKLPQKSSALIRSPAAAEREAQLRSPQSFHALSRAGSDANGGVNAEDEGAAKVILASPAVMKAIRASEAQRDVLHEGNADER